jgi:hypothetical protein
MVRPQDRPDPLSSVNPMVSLREKYPGEPGQSGQTGPIFQASKPDPNAQWSWLPPSGRDYGFGALGAVQSGVKAFNDRAEDAQSGVDRLRDFSDERQKIIDDPGKSPAEKAVAAHEQDIAQLAEERNMKLVNDKLGPAKIIPEAARAPLSKDLWDTVQKGVVPAGEELGKLGETYGKPFVKGVPVAGLVLTGIQTGIDIQMNHHSVGRSIAEGVGSTIGAGVFGVGAAVLVGPETAGVASIPAGIAAGAAGSYIGGKAADWLTDRTDDVLGIDH